MQPRKLFTQITMRFKWISTVRKQMQTWLISPSKDVVDPSVRIRAELIATSTLFFALLTVAGTIAVSRTLAGSLAPILLTALSAVTLTGYVLSRSRYFHLIGFDSSELLDHLTTESNIYLYPDQREKILVVCKTWIDR